MQVGNGLFHCPSSPHISTEIPFRYFPGPSQLNVRMWLGRMGIQFSGKSFTVNPWTVGGGSHLEDETKVEEEEKKTVQKARFRCRNHWPESLYLLQFLYLPDHVRIHFARFQCVSVFVLETRRFRPVEINHCQNYSCGQKFYNHHGSTWIPL